MDALLRSKLTTVGKALIQIAEEDWSLIEGNLELTLEHGLYKLQVDLTLDPNTEITAKNLKDK